jgi:4-hydroxymandelate oxidase
MRWIDGLRQRAEKILPAPVAEYYAHGASAQVTAREAPASWESYRLRPRVLRDVQTVSTATSVLGYPVTTPVLIAPTTLQRQAHDDGEAATLRAAGRAGSLACVSSNSGTRFEVLAAQGVPWWVQGYLLRDRGISAAMLQQARDCGATAVVLTVDTPRVGTKHYAGTPVWEIIPPEHLRANFDKSLPDEAFAKADDLTYADIGWLREVTGLPVVVKGVLRADDAVACAEAGAAAIQVSNHGGRQLDLTVQTAQALPEIAAAVAGMGVEVYVDGGLRRGEHILMALALGAQAVFLGRPVLWALAAEGEAGVSRLLSELTAELAEAMALAGTADLAAITPDLVTPNLFPRQ